MEKARKSRATPVLIAALLILALIGILLLRKFTGYASYVTAQGGYIGEILIHHEQSTIHWQGYYGLALMETSFNDQQTDTASPGAVEEKHLIFSCLQPGVQHEVYAMSVNPNTLNWNNVWAGTTSMVDSYLNKTANSTDSTNNTFNYTSSYLVNGNNITNVPTAYTFIRGIVNTTKFPVGILNFSGNIVFVTRVADVITTNYKSGNSNYQILVAVPNSSLLYYFSTDAGDNCPEGLQSGFGGNGFATGYARHNITGQILPNVTIYISSATNTTDSNGYFNMTVPIGYHQFVATKDGYNTYFGAVNITLSNTTLHNFSMTEFRGLSEGNGTLRGIVRDNATNSTLSGVNVAVAGRVTSSNGTGNFSVNVSAGEHQLVATKSGYQLYVANVTINFSNTTTHNIDMASTTGTLEGLAFRSDTSAVLEDVTVSIAGSTTTTNSSGRYSVSVIPGTHTASATKSSFTGDAAQATITAGLISYRNFSLTPTSGTLNGTILDNVTNATINGTRVYAANNLVLTSEGGNFSFSVAAGTHVLWVLKEGYETHTVNVSVAGLATTTVTARLRPTNGTLTGNVTDANTGAAISGATVTVNGVTATTNASGAYNMTTYTGTHTVAAIKQGYENAVTNATIEPGRVTGKNLQMTPANFTPSRGVGYVRGKVVDSTETALENVSVSIAGEINYTNSSGHYYLNISAGKHNIVGFKSGYQTYAAEILINESNTTIHNFNMSTVVVQGLGEGLGAGLSPGLGAGLGPGTGQVAKKTPQQIVKEKEGVKKFLDVSRIVKKLSQGTFTTVPVKITNYKNTPILINLGVTGEVSPMITLDKTAFAIAPGEQAEALLTILGTADPGVYNGSLDVTGDAQESVPIDLLVIERNKIPIETLDLRVELFEKRINPGTALKFRVGMQNLLKDEEYTVLLKYSIKPQGGNESFELGDEEILLGSSQSLLKDFLLPEDTPTGDYALIVDADYLTFHSSHTAAFSVVLPLYKYSFLGLIPLWALAASVMTLSTGTFGVLAYKKQKAKKKRYQIGVDYKGMPKAGPRSAFVGKFAETENKAYFDIDLFQVHTLVAGSSGSGKTVAATVLAEEALSRGASVIVFDPTAQWTGFLRKMAEKRMLALYPQFGMKPSDARGFSGNVRQITDKREVIDIRKFMRPGEMTVFAINRLEPEDIDVIVANTVKQVFKAHLPESKELKLLIVFDEVHRLLPKFGGSGQGFLQIERAAREFRKWGVGLLLISQVLTDFVGEIKANINTEIQMRTRDEKDLKRIEESYGAAALKSVVKASIGTGMIENANYNRGKPFFVSFRPMLHNHAALPDEELENYNKYNLMLDELDYQLEQLKTENVDIFDIELELKLAKDKLKTGNFNMVDIYLESVRPRIEDEWAKLGKQPKHFKIQLSEGEEEEVKAAKEEEKPQPQQPQQQPVNDTLSTAKEIVAKINTNIKAGKAAEAKQLYPQLTEAYKLLSKEQKTAVYNDIVSLQKMMPK